jgi:hypothetical protein
MSNQCACGENYSAIPASSPRPPKQACASLMTIALAWVA